MASVAKVTSSRDIDCDLSRILGNHLDNAEHNTTELTLPECLTYNLEDLSKLHISNKKYKFTAMHINIHSIPAKFDQLKNIITEFCEANISLDFILLCETFLADNNARLYEIPGYNFVLKNRQLNRRGGVAIYIKEGIRFNIRNDLATNYDSEF